MKKNNHLKVYILMIIAVWFWAGAFIAGKLGVDDFSSIQLSFFRFFFAVIILLPLLIIKEPNQWKPKRVDWKQFFLLGTVGMIGYHLLFFSSLKYTLAYKAAMINAINPLLTAIIATIILKEKITKKQLVLLALALIGVLLTMVNWQIGLLLDLNFNKGDILMALAMLCWVAYGILVKKVISNFGALKLMTYTLIAACIVLLPFTIYDSIINGLVLDRIQPWFGIIYMAIFATVFAYTAQQYAIQHIGAANAALFINLVPIASMILAVVILNENVIKQNIISAGIVIFAVAGNGYLTIRDQ